MIGLDDEAELSCLRTLRRCTVCRYESTAHCPALLDPEFRSFLLYKEESRRLMAALHRVHQERLADILRRNGRSLHYETIHRIYHGRHKDFPMSSRSIYLNLASMDEVESVGSGVYRIARHA